MQPAFDDNVPKRAEIVASEMMAAHSDEDSTLGAAVSLNWKTEFRVGSIFTYMEADHGCLRAG